MIEAVERDRHKRDQILAVSSRLFSQRGFANVSIRDICDQAGVTPPTIYHYFSSKDLLFQEVILKTLNLRDFRDALAAAIGTHPDPAGQLQEFIMTCLADFPRDFFNPGMFLQSSTQVNQTSMDHVSAELKAVDDIVMAILREGIARGKFRDVDPDQTHRYLMNTLISYLLLDVHYQQNDRLEDTAHFIFEMLMDGMRQKDRTSQIEEFGGIE